MVSSAPSSAGFPGKMQNKIAIGIDTSCYTTSVAAADGNGIVFEKKAMLFVQQGNRGLRQSDALFQHVRQLPDLVEDMMAAVKDLQVGCVCVSGRPVDAADSYMPVFLAGLGLGRSLAAALHCPLHITTHQRGHIRAAQIDNEALMENESLLALHLSGGTTELLLVTPDNRNVCCQRIGGTTDISAGQLIDRAGVMLGLKFPCGGELEKLAASAGNAKGIKPIKITVRGGECNMSGAENRIRELVSRGEDRGKIAYFTLDFVAKNVIALTEQAREKYPALPVIFAGGVMRNKIIREKIKEKIDNIYFASEELSSDNAVGTAYLGLEIMKKGAVVRNGRS